MQETQVGSLSREDPLGKEMATNSSILAWRIPWTEEVGGLQCTGCKEADTTEQLHFTSLRFGIAFLPRNKHLLILWLQSPPAVILETQNMKSVTTSIVSPPICYELMRTDAMIFVF